jgi:hypothetical protein
MSLLETDAVTRTIRANELKAGDIMFGYNYSDTLVSDVEIVRGAGHGVAQESVRVTYCDDTSDVFPGGGYTVIVVDYV